MKSTYQVGLDTLLSEHPEWLRDRRVGLVTHAAGVDTRGRHGAYRIAESGAKLTALFGPEHGWQARGDAGEKIGHQRHPVLDIPIHSLYGETRKPTPEMLEDLDVLVFDLQDLACRCYTYGSTLRLVLEACAETHCEVVIADRPVPLPGTVDGPMLEADCESFVGLLPAPLAYGMTPAETAAWLGRVLNLDLSLQLAPMRGYLRAPAQRQCGAPWVPPSPGIRSWESACAYLVTVFTEALPQFGCDRGGVLPFQCFTGEGLDGPALADGLNERALSGWQAEPLADGLRLVIAEPEVFRPVETAVHLLHAVQALHGVDAVWGVEGVRPEFFDQLMGSTAVREALQRGDAPDELIATWTAPRAKFIEERTPFLLYPNAVTG